MEIFQSILSSFTTVGVLLLILPLTYIYLTTRRPKNFPPGPPALPIVGSIPYVSSDPNEYIDDFAKMHKKYGDIFSLKMGKMYVFHFGTK